MSSSTADETGASKYPDMALAQQMHRLLSSSPPEHRSVELETQVFDKILVELENPSLYRSLQTKLYQDKTPTLASAKITKDTLTALETQHADHVKTLEENIATARESAGDMEVLEAQLQLAQFAAKSLSETEALQAYQAILQSSKLSSGKQMDVLMEMTRVASFYDNSKLADDYLEQTLKLAASSGGGDWDRRNRLQVYQALQQLLHRNLQKAASLLVDCIATFSCTELCTYTECILYATLTNLLHLPRVELKEKIIDGPEVLGVAKELPAVVSRQRRVLGIGVFVYKANTRLILFKHTHFLCTFLFSSNWFKPFTTVTTRPTCMP
jgi:26S proteasome regulatory subunit N7